MLLYHTTYNADAILAEGFKDGTGYYMTDRPWSGVWLSDRPLDANEGAKGDTVLVIEMPEDEVLSYEWVEEGKPYREFLVPADLVNRYRPFRVTQE
jgi:hypothetical protein